jgi:hypothetical protein
MPNERAEIGGSGLPTGEFPAVPGSPSRQGVGTEDGKPAAVVRGLCVGPHTDPDRIECG